LGIRSTAMLTADFPVDNLVDLIASIAKFDSLITQGFLGDYNDFLSIEAWIGAPMDDLAEVFAAPTATYTGAAGNSDRHYAVVPNYPLEYGVGSGASVAGNFLSFLGGKPPYGYPPSSAANTAENTTDGVRRLYGAVSPQVVAPDTAATLDENNYVTITTPGAQNIPGVLFDIVSTPDDGTTWALIAANVAPATAYRNQGLYLAPALYGAAYVMRPHVEIGYDPTAPGTIVYGSLHRDP
jgi:hypothetical protein